MSKRLLSALLVLVLLLGAAGTALAAYPEKAISVIVPVNPGGDTDTNARLFAKYLEKELGQAVAIVNVSGASGVVGMDQVRQSPADGYTALFFHAEAMIPEIAGIIDYKLTEAFDMCAVCIVDNTTVLATHKDAPYKTMEELVAYAAANPGKVEFGMATGGYPHLVGLALEKELGVDLNLVDVGGNAAKTTALLGHNTDVINTQYGLNKANFDSGEFINLGLTSPERNPLMPDVITTTEQGYTMDFNKFFFYVMPKGTPADVVETFASAVKRVTENPEFVEEASKLYLTPVFYGQAEGVAFAEAGYDYLAQYKDLFLAASGQ